MTTHLDEKPCTRKGEWWLPERQCYVCLEHVPADERPKRQRWDDDPRGAPPCEWHLRKEP